MENMAEADNNMSTFDMGSLRTNLPSNRRGLSRYYSGKSRSFTCMADVQCVEDLKKPEHIPDAKKRKKYSERNKEILPIPPYPYCRRVDSSTNQCAAPCHVGV
ncbi:hypothetical protein TorRG33x02_240470 [Trema orientale]|uniref:Uncharacterized protein n=1 Tax=Trema orientale TaxID=63057 RepID=A0A2P5DVT9_TREOI|nr:hypothetical protein TorRG33x02_240470 [Trema orientale]